MFFSFKKIVESIFFKSIQWEGELLRKEKTCQ